MKLDIVKVHENRFQRRKQWPKLFDLNSWRGSVSYQLIKEYCQDKEAPIIEVGCLTGHHLLLLAEEGYQDLTGFDFCQEAIDWGIAHDEKKIINFQCMNFPDDAWTSWWEEYSRIVLFDVIEHVHHLRDFLDSVGTMCNDETRVLVLVPLGEHYRDEGHVNFYPSPDALKNLLDYYFDVEEIRVVDNGTKIFAVCGRSE